MDQKRKFNVFFLPEKKPSFVAAAFVWATLSFLLGLYFTYNGVFGVDAYDLWRMGKFFVFQEELKIYPLPDGDLQWYGPLWEFFSAIFSDVLLRFLHDPLWVRSGLVFSLWSTTGFLVFRWIYELERSVVTAALCVAGLLGLIRIGGHALYNTKDVPAACFYLMAAIFLYKGLQDLFVNGEKPKSFLLKKIFFLSAISLLPCLIRPLLIFLLLALSCILFLFFWKKKARFSKLEIFLFASIPCFFYIFLLPLTFIGFWREGYFSWWRAIFGFEFMLGHHTFPISVLHFGIHTIASDIPRYYALLWFPVVLSPMACIACLVGAVLGIHSFFSWAYFKRKKICIETILSDMSLSMWLFLLFLIPALAALVWRPSLFNEDRHFLFLYPPLVVALLLQLHFFEKKWKLLMAILIFGVALFEYNKWREYSYIYKSPLIQNRSASQFEGDYWGICAPYALRKLLQEYSQVTKVWTNLYYFSLYPQLERIKKLSNLKSDPKKVELFYEYRFDRKLDPRSAFYRIGVNSVLGRQDAILTDIAAGRAKLLFTIKMPLEENACVVGFYPGASNQSPSGMEYKKEK